MLCLWHRPAAVAPTGPLVWVLPYAEGAALNKKKKRVKVTENILATNKASSEREDLRAKDGAWGNMSITVQKEKEHPDTE